MVNTASKDILARLLATENITVQHSNVPTASFNVRDRILTLPMWDDMEDYTYDHLVGHEVGHALYTPEKGWHGAVVDGGPVLRSFLNVVEDARIEKLIQRRYPGMRRSFVKSYRKLLKDGFFGVDIEHINSMNLIDRINTYFKCGASIGVQFSTEELPWLERIQEAETWEEVETISKELFAFCKERFERKKEEELEREEDSQEDFSGEDYQEDLSDDDIGDPVAKPDLEKDAEEDGDADLSEDSQGLEDSEEEGEETDSNPSEEEGEETDSNPQEQGGYGDQDFEEAEKSYTEEQLHENIEQNFSECAFESVHNFNTSSIDGNVYVKSYKNTIKLVRCASHDVMVYVRRRQLMSQDEYMDSLYQEFHSENKRIVDHMVKEFEMKKKAEEYARSSTAKTGVIDTVKMNNYLFDDDIFRKVTVVPEGKNHGILIYLDWSGSMMGDLVAAVQQMCLIGMFCRKANIPFRVFLFTDEKSHIDAKNIPKDELFTNFSLREIFSSSMKKSEFRYMIGAMLAHGQYYDSVCLHKDLYSPRIEIAEEMLLCGTPLDSAIMTASDVHREFKKCYGLDKVSTFFITDGMSHPVAVKPSTRFLTKPLPIGGSALYPKPRTLIRISDTQTKKQYRITPGDNTTDILIQMYKDRTGSETIGYFITKSGKKSYERVVRDFNRGRGIVPSETLSEFYRVNQFARAPHPAYDEFFAISGKLMKVDSSEIKVEYNASKAKIRNAFAKSQGNKKLIRTMTSQVMDRIA